jgi:hypothetical protein
MATTMTAGAVRRGFRPSFFFWMTVAMACCVFSGFGLTYWVPMATGTLTTLPPIVHVHGLFYSAWMVLLVTQAALIGARNVTMHRTLGTFGIAIATGVLFTGLLITLMFGHATPTTALPFYYDLMYLGFAAVLAFGALFTLAIRRRGVPEQHRLLILFATIPLLPPGINRLYQVTFSLNYLPVLATYLTMDALVAAILIHDWRTNRKLGNASLIGTAAVLALQLLHAPIVHSAAFANVCRVLTDLVYYR